MGRTYAGILGLIAFATVVARGVVHGASVSSIIPLACGCLFAFAAIGYVVGQIASRTVHDAVLAKFQKKLHAELDPPTSGNTSRSTA